MLDIELHRELSKIQGQISAMVIKDQEDDDMLAKIPKLYDMLLTKESELRKRLDAMELAFKSNRQEINSALGKVNETNNMISHVMKELSSLQVDHSSLHNGVDDQFRRYDELHLRDAGINKMFAGCVEKMQKDIDDLHESFQDMQEKHEGYSSLVSNKVNALTDLTHEDTTARREVAGVMLLLSNFSMTTEAALDAIRKDSTDFKNNVADRLTDAANIIEKRFVSQLDDVKSLMAESLATGIKGRLDNIENEIGVINSKFNLVEREFAIFGRQLDKIAMSLKAIELSNKE